MSEGGGGNGARRSRFAPYLLWPRRAGPGPVLPRPAVRRSVRTSLSDGDDPLGLRVRVGVRQLRGRSATYQTQFLRSFCVRGDRDAALPPDRLPARVLHRVPGGRFKNLLLGLVVVAVLHDLPHPDARVEDDPRRPGLRRRRPPRRSGCSATTTGCSARRGRWSAGSRTTSCRSWCCRSTSSLEKIDPRLIDAAGTCTRTPSRAFRKVVFPLSLPGVFAGSLLAFIPAAGDFVNAVFLGNREPR